MLTYRIAGPLLRLLDPERAHTLTIRALCHGLVPAAPQADDPILATQLWGRAFPNPLGLAAGFDKDAVAIAPLLKLGFGFVEVGSITPRPQGGNPRPRIFRLPEDRAIINRFGFNSAGLDTAAAHIAAWRRGASRGILGINLGKNRDSEDAAADYVAGVRVLARYADYLVVNVSSPNTPGLRALQHRGALERLLERVQDALLDQAPENQPALLIKVAPDLTDADKEDIASVALDAAVAGLIVSNTTVSRPAGLRGRHREEHGGLSGRPLFELSTRVLGEFRRLTGGALPLIGVGGIASGSDAYAKIRAGASLVQLYTGLVYEGPALVARIKADLAALLRRDGFQSLGDAVGAEPP